MSMKIGHAAGDENNGAHGGQAGDQTGRETRIQDWYACGWTVLLRPKSADVAERMASTCETLCKSNLVGYDQWERNTLWDELEKVNWNANQLKTKCETDCSAFVSTCARAAGINIPRVALGGEKYNAPVTWTMRQAFSSTGAFDVLTDSKYLSTDKYLKRGDILVKEPQSGGHTAMVLGEEKPSSGENIISNNVLKEKKATEIAYHFDKQYAGRYKCTAYILCIRSGAGINKKLLTTIKKDKEVMCYGYYNLSGNVPWLYVQFEQNGIRYSAYASKNYLQRVK